MQDNDELNSILMKRAVPPKAPDGLAERIIFAAVSQVQQVSPRALGFWNELMTMLVLPHPRVAIAVVVLFGLAVGVQASDSLSILRQDWSSFMNVNEGGWL